MSMMLGGHEIVQEIFKTNDTYDMLQKAIQFFEFIIYYQEKNGKAEKDKNGNKQENLSDLRPLLALLKQEDTGFPKGEVPEWRLYPLEGLDEPIVVREPIELISKSSRPKDRYVCAFIRQKIIEEAVKYLDRTESLDSMSFGDGEESEFNVDEFSDEELYEELEQMDEELNNKKKD